MNTLDSRQPFKSSYRLGASGPSSTRIRAELADGRSAQQALEAPFNGTAYTSGELGDRRQTQSRERAVQTWKRVAALGAIAVFGIFVAPKVAEEIAPSATGQTYTQQDLGQLPQKEFRFKAGQGVDDAIVKVDGNKDIFSDGPELAAVESYVEGQEPNGVPQPNDTVHVPVLPGGGK